MPKGQAPFPRKGKGFNRGHFGDNYMDSLSRRDDNARHPESKQYTNKPRPALQRGEYLDDQIDKMSQ